MSNKSLIINNYQQLQNGSDIRGVALPGVIGEEVNLTSEVATAIGKSFANWLSKQCNKLTAELTISVGRDSRLSGQGLRKSLVEGIISCGCQVYDFGIASTPAMFMSTVHPDFKCDGAIMLTASHLPFNRNGFKFFTVNGGLEKQDIKAILKLAEANNFAEAAVKGTVKESNFIAIYGAGLANQVREAVKHPDNYEQPLTGLKIVVDAGNGAGGFYVDEVLNPLGADTTGSQFLDPDGTFPNHIPNPENSEAMASIQQAVLDNQADFGIIFDTDVDRVAAVDHLGNELNRNRLIALISAIVLQEHPGSTIVTDSITSDGLAEFIEQNLQGVHHRFKRGYKNVINEAIALNNKQQESWLAIETSGHAAMKENYFLDDGAYLATKLLSELAKAKLKNQLITDLITDLKGPTESEEFRLKIKTKDFKEYGNQLITELRRFAETQTNWLVVPNNYEGVRIACQSANEQGWLLLRLSLHDPVIPINIESNVDNGVNAIARKLLVFLQGFDQLDLSSLSQINL